MLLFVDVVLIVVVIVRHYKKTEQLIVVPDTHNCPRATRRLPNQADIVSSDPGIRDTYCLQTVSLLCASCSLCDLKTIMDNEYLASPR